MNIEVIRHCLALTRNGNMGITSKQLGISKSALSKHMAALEKELGVQLFERTRSGLSLTAFGVEIVPHLFNVLTAWDETLARAEEINEHENNKLIVSGMTDAEIVLNAIALLYSEFENSGHRLALGFSLAEVDTPIYSMNKADIVFDYEWQEAEYAQYGIEAIRLANIPFVAVLRKEHRLAKKESLHIEELEHETFMTMKGLGRDWAWKYVEDGCRRHGFIPTCRSNYGTLMIDLLTAASQLQNEVLVIESYSARRAGLTSSPLAAVIPIADEDLYMPLSAMYKTDNTNPTLAQTVEVLKRAYGGEA